MSELPSPYGNCEPSVNYEQSKCISNCKANYVVDKCNCRDVYMPGEKYIYILCTIALMGAVQCRTH